MSNDGPGRTGEVRSRLVRTLLEPRPGLRSEAQRVERAGETTGYALLGSELSPFAMKVRAVSSHAGLRVRWVPDASAREGRRAEVLRLALRLGLFSVTHPPPSPLDDAPPLVPYLFGDDGTVLVDSSAIGRFLDLRGARLLPEEPAARFACSLLDEAIDEVGLYLLHHHRWVSSAAETWAPERLAFELGARMGPLARPFADRFATRQVRRLPYLFSVAPEGYTLPGLAAGRTPPARAGFPPTHALLDTLFDAWLDALGQLLSSRPYLLGERFTLADASLYGMMASIARLDPAARRRVASRAPALLRWLRQVERRTETRGEVALDPALGPVLDTLAGAFVPLMIQNEAAFVRASAAGATRFNEAAFDRGESLYDGALLGRPFRAVVKTFQVRVFRALRREWSALPAEARRALLACSPALGALPSA